MGRSKYGAKKVEKYGIKFDSKLELSCYEELLTMQKKGKIKGLCRADTFLLLDGFKHEHAYTRKSGIEKPMDRQRKITYTPDFYCIDADTQEHIIIEVKSDVTSKAKDYPLRRKMFLKLNPDVVFIEWGN